MKWPICNIQCEANYINHSALANSKISNKFLGNLRDGKLKKIQQKQKKKRKQPRLQKK